MECMLTAVRYFDGVITFLLGTSLGIGVQIWSARLNTCGRYVARPLPTASHAHDAHPNFCMNKRALVCVAAFWFWSVDFVLTCASFLLPLSLYSLDRVAPLFPAPLPHPNTPKHTHTHTHEGGSRWDKRP